MADSKSNKPALTKYISTDDVWTCINEQSIRCDEKYVFEKSFWRRGVAVIVAIIAIITGAAGGTLAWAMTSNGKIQDNTSGRRELERRISVVERQNEVILKNLRDAANNQNVIIRNQDALSKKLDLAIKRAGSPKDF